MTDLCFVELYIFNHANKLSINICVATQVCGAREKRNDNVWLAAEGVYLPITETK